MKLFTKHGIRTSLVDGDLIKFSKSPSNGSTVGIEVLRYSGEKSGITEKISNRENLLDDVSALYSEEDCSDTVYGINLISITQVCLRKCACLMTSVASSTLGIKDEIVFEDDHTVIFLVVA